MAEEPQPTPPQCPRLPPEIIDAIIDQLDADPKVLALCALVCKSWVPASRHHLFQKITITKTNISDAIRLLSSVGCTIALAIVHLSLFKIDALSNLRGITCRLPHVTRLSLQVSVSSDVDFPGEALAPLLPNLELLEFDTFQFETSRPLGWILYRCPRLRRISACYTTIELNLTESSWICALTPELKSLRVYRADPFVENLVTRWNSVVPGLTTLEIGCSSSLEKILMIAGSSLQILRLYEGRWMSSECARSFTFLTQLRSLSIESQSGLLPEHIYVPSRLLEALDHLASPCLVELTIALPSSCKASWPSNYFDRHTWSSLSDLLETPRFSSTLRSLTFQFVEEPIRNYNLEDGAREGLVRERGRDGRARERQIAEIFRSYAAQGILHVQSKDYFTFL